MKKISKTTKSSFWKAVLATVVALAFVLPGSATFANFEEKINEIVSSSDSDGLQITHDGTIENTDSVDWWPMFHHDLERSGYSTSPAPNTNTVLWECDTMDERVEGSPAIVDDKIYFGSNDGKVYCIYADGNVGWETETGGAVKSSPAVNDGKVYVGSCDGDVYCLNAGNGSEIWSFGTGAEVVSSPAVADGKVYVGSVDNKLYCLNAENGSEIWNYDTGSEVESSPAVVDGKVYVGNNDYTVYCVNATNGNLIWDQGTADDSIISSPAVVDGKVYYGSKDGKVYCLYAGDGNIVWEIETGGAVKSSPAVHDGKVYVGSNDGDVYCLNAGNGSEIWSFGTGGAVEASPAVADGKVYVGSDDHKLYCLNAENGSEIWNYDSGEPVSSAAIANCTVYATKQEDDPGVIFAFRDSNQPPYTPSDPDPVDGATDVSIEADISWTGGDPNPCDTVTYDVYFGTTSPPPKVIGNQSDTTYDPGTLDYETKYYWQIVAWDKSETSTSGPIWEFTTTEEELPELEIVSISGVFGVSAIIKNVGDVEATDVDWNITLDGGLIILGKETMDTIDSLPAGDEETVKSELILGIGRTTITVHAVCAEGVEATKTASGLVILFFVIGVK